MKSALAIGVMVGLLLVSAHSTLAGRSLGGGAVGGVEVDADGVAANISAKTLDTLRIAREAAMRPVATDMAKVSKMRKVSLRRLAEAIREAQAKEPGAPLGDDFQYLAGLQRIQYVFVYPEQKDIVIAGPAAGWKMNARAEVVGADTGLPVLRLEDLAMALSSVEQAQQSIISVSIDPTAEGIKRLDAFLKKQKTFQPEVKEGVETSLGKQNITLTGVPATSRFAHVMLAADYRMKRYAMHLDPAPISGMPSYLDLLRNARGKPSSDLSPRWWMAADYKPMLTDADHLAWELRPGVKVMSEDERRSAEGNVQGTGKTNPIAKKWADTMTAKYSQLAAKDSVFAELRNCMDIAVLAALVSKEKLAEKAGLDLSAYTDGKVGPVETLGTPKHVATEVSLAKSGREWIITASGGVQFSGFSVIEKRETSDQLGKQRPADIGSKQWWWD
jgi:hypothetical protein